MGKIKIPEETGPKYEEYESNIGNINFWIASIVSPRIFVLVIHSNQFF